MLNGIHLLALLEAPGLLDDDIPEELRADWRGLRREWDEMQAELKETQRHQVLKAVHKRVWGKDIELGIDVEP